MLQSKLAYAQQFALQRQLKANDLAYTTEQDLLDQEVSRQDQADTE